MSLGEVDNHAMVRMLYKALLNREPDPEGFAHHVFDLVSANRTLHQMALDIVNSPEFADKYHPSSPRLHDKLPWAGRNRDDAARNAPKYSREVFEMLGEFDESAGLDALLDMIDWTGVTPHQIYGAFLDRLPKCAEVTVIKENYSGKTHARETLLGAEFQLQIIARLLNAFPDKSRLFHVHVPKAAGTDLREILVAKYPYIHFNHSQAESTSTTALLSHLRDFVRGTRSADKVLITGHIGLKWYIERSLCRFVDRVFAVLRHPHDSLLSLVNYYLRRIYEDPECRSPDTQSYARYLGVGSFEAKLPVEAQREIGVRMLANDDMMNANRLCNMLGAGTALSALELMAQCNIELTEVGRYGRWLKERWGVVSQTRLNVSPQLITFSGLAPAQRQHIREICEEDMKLYTIIVKALDRRHGCRVFGAELV